MAATERTPLLNGDIYRNGIHVVDVPSLETTNADYDEIYTDNKFPSCLSLEELLPYKDNPWWQNLRRAIFCSFWLSVLLIFLLACSLSYLQSKTCVRMAEVKAPDIIEGTITGPTKLAT